MIRYLGKTGLLLFSYLPSALKLSAYRILGAKIGKGCYLGIGSYILPYFSGFEGIEMADGVLIGDRVVISGRKIYLGREAEIKDNAKITGEASFFMGDYSYVGENTLINLRRKVSIGNEAGVGANCSLYTHGVWLPALDGYPAKFGEIVIKDRAWVSASIFINPGVSIGANAVIGSGSVVTKDVPDNVFAAGNPAKEINTFDYSKKPGQEEKKRVLWGMMHEFTERFREETKILEESPGRYIFETVFGKRRMLLFQAKERCVFFCKDSIEAGEAKDVMGLKKGGVGDVIAISNSFGEKAKDSLGKVSWIDLGERAASLKGNKASGLLLRSLRNNGLRLTETK